MTLPFITFALLGLVQLAAFVLLVWLGWHYFDRRYKRNRSRTRAELIALGYEATQEIFIDPKDGKRCRVYYNPANGDREYLIEEA